MLNISMPFRTSGVCFASSAPGTVADIVAVQNTAALATMLTAAITVSFKHRHTISSLAAKHCSNPVIPPRIVIWLTWTEFPFVSGGFVTACKERDQAMSPFIPAFWDLFLLPTKQGSSAVGQSLVDAALKTPSTLRNWVVGFEIAALEVKKVRRNGERYRSARTYEDPAESYLSQRDGPDRMSDFGSSATST
jgi:hypothetical protein